MVFNLLRRRSDKDTADVKQEKALKPKRESFLKRASKSPKPTPKSPTKPQPVAPPAKPVEEEKLQAPETERPAVEAVPENVRDKKLPSISYVLIQTHKPISFCRNQRTR